MHRGIQECSNSRDTFNIILFKENSFRYMYIYILLLFIDMYLYTCTRVFFVYAIIRLLMTLY